MQRREPRSILGIAAADAGRVVGDRRRVRGAIRRFGDEHTIEQELDTDVHDGEARSARATSEKSRRLGCVSRCRADSEILEQHVNALPARLTEKSDLLFPSKIGGYQSPNVEIADFVAKISKHLSPYFMRRTFQDLCASVHDFVARSIGGHATVEMQQHYSSVNVSVRWTARVNGTELAKVISLVGARRKARPGKRKRVQIRRLVVSETRPMVIAVVIDQKGA